MPLILKATTPIVRIDPSSVHMQMLVDTLWTDIQPPVFEMPDSLNPMFMVADYKWKPKTRYKVSIDSLGMTDVLGYPSRPFSQEFATRAEEDYSSITFTPTGFEGDAVVELLNNQDKPVASRKVEKGQAEFRFLMPGVYYARIYLDRNGNGKYDGGSLTDSIQPEEVYYFPSKINLKKNWEKNETCDVFATAVDS